MRISIVCEDCDYKHHLERTEFEVGPIPIICHGCELPLQAILEAPLPAAPHPELAVVAPIQFPPSGFSFLAEPPSANQIGFRSERSRI